MKRYYSHYTFIYPDIYLKSHIVEMDDNGKIIRVFPFTKEVEKTEFYSGVLVYMPLSESIAHLETKNFVSVKDISVNMKKSYSDTNIQYRVCNLDGEIVF